jgi:hypothetical protein
MSKRQGVKKGNGVPPATFPASGPPAARGSVGPSSAPLLECVMPPYLSRPIPWCEYWLWVGQGLNCCKVPAVLTHRLQTVNSHSHGVRQKGAFAWTQDITTFLCDGSCDEVPRSCLTSHLAHGHDAGEWYVLQRLTFAPTPVQAFARPPHIWTCACTHGHRQRAHPHTHMNCTYTQHTHTHPQTEGHICVHKHMHIQTASR